MQTRPPQSCLGSVQNRQERGNVAAQDIADVVPGRARVPFGVTALRQLGIILRGKLVPALPHQEAVSEYGGISGGLVIFFRHPIDHVRTFHDFLGTVGAQEEKGR